jgi:hypothetical protein
MVKIVSHALFSQIAITVFICCVFQKGLLIKSRRLNEVADFLLLMFTNIPKSFKENRD